jgi:hypothetical protein
MTQKMSLTMGGPAFGYNGPISVVVWYDTIYQTFCFVPFEIPEGTLHGVVTDRGGKPVAWEQVIAVAGGVKYRTFTNARGEYRFPTKFAGPIDIRVGGVAQRLPQLEPEKSIDFRM